MKKKVLSLVMAFVFLALTVTPILSVDSFSVSAPSSPAELSSRMNRIVNGTYGVGKHFRNDQSKPCCLAGTSCPCHGHHDGFNYVDDSFCNCKVATADIAGTTGGIQCFGYARYVFYQLFGVAVPTSISGHRLGSSCSGMKVVGDCSGSNTFSKTKSVFNKARMGDFIQTRTSRGGNHTMIVYSVSSDSLTVLECNHDGQCYIGKREMSFSSFASEYPAFTLYTATNHPGGGANIPAPTLTVDNKLKFLFGFRAYPRVGSTFEVKKSDLSSRAGEIYTSDECVIKEIYTNGWCKVEFPMSGTNTTRTGYTKVSNFVDNYSSSLKNYTANKYLNFYSTASRNTKIYRIYPGDKCYTLGTSGSSTQIFMPLTSKGCYILGWVASSDLKEESYDSRFNKYCPIKCYPCVSENFEVKKSDHSTRAGEIYTGDYCTISAVYSDGWCYVTFPYDAGGGTLSGYTPLSNFVYDVNYEHKTYKTESQLNVYPRKDLGTFQNWWVGAGDTFFVVSEYGRASQVFYEIDPKYGGGYKLGWVATDNLPKTEYTVSYNANGGSGAPGRQKKIHNENLVLSSSKPSRTGYTFVGWSTSSSASTPSYYAGSIYSENANLTLYAVWRINKYTIVYNANGGIDAPGLQTKNYGSSIKLSSSKPENPGYEFLGWAKSSSASSPQYKAGASFSENADTTLYAVWRKNIYTVKYNLNGGNGNIADGKKTYGEKMTITSERPSRTGYTFLGWSEYPDFQEAEFLPGQDFNMDKNTTLYAIWKKNTYKISFDANGGSGAPDSQNKDYGTDISLNSKEPVRTGYVFQGWSENKNAVDALYQPGSTFRVNENITLYAVWKANTYTVLYDGNGAEGTAFTSQHIYDKESALKKNTYTLDGYEFKGWTDVKDSDTVKYLDGQNIKNLTSENNGKITLYAVWEKIPLTHIPGDINDDGVVNNKDLTRLMKYLSGEDVLVSEDALDVNGDGNINNKDLTRLMKFLSGEDVDIY